MRNPVGRGLPAAYAICLLYGIGYSTAATFLVQLLHDKPGFGARGPAAIWTLVGIGAIVGPIVLGRCADRIGGRLVLITAIVTLASSILAFLPHWPIAAAALVALVFGGSFIGVGMAVLLFTRERVDEADAPSALGYATSFTSLGQMLGPAVLGWIASHWGLANAFLVAAMSVGAAAIVLCVPQRADEGASREAGGR